MFTKNVNITEGAINGATTTIISFSYDEIGVVTTIMVQVIDSNITMNLKQNTFLHKYTCEFFNYKASFSIVLHTLLQDKNLKAQQSLQMCTLIFVVHLLNRFNICNAIQSNKLKPLKDKYTIKGANPAHLKCKIKYPNSILFCPIYSKIKKNCEN